jgi:transposase
VTIVGMSADDREASTSNLADTKPASASGRRRWPEAVKRELVAATFEPGASVSIVARRHDVNTNQLFKWRRQFRDRAGDALLEPVQMLPVEIAPPTLVLPSRSTPTRDPGRRRAETPSRASEVPPAAAGSVEIKLPGGARVTITGTADPATVAAAIRAATAARRRR